MKITLIPSRHLFVGLVLILSCLGTMAQAESKPKKDRGIIKSIDFEGKSMVLSREKG